MGVYRGSARFFFTSIVMWGIKKSRLVLSEPVVSFDIGYKGEECGDPKGSISSRIRSQKLLTSLFSSVRMSVLVSE